MDFEQLQQSWRSQPIDMPADLEQIKNRVAGKWNRQQRSVMRSNIFTTIAFAAVLVNFGWVYSSFHAGHSMFFGGSILFMAALLVVYLWVLWRGYAHNKTDPSQPSDAYLGTYLQKLHWRRKTITSFTWIYTVLLWLALMLYYVDITSGGSALLRIGAPVVTTAYIFGMTLIVRYTKQKKQLRKLDDLIADIQQLKTALNA